MAVTLEQFLEFLNASSLGEESRERGLADEALKAAQTVVERRVGPLTTGNRECRLYPVGDALILPLTHVQAVVSVVDPEGNDVEPVDVNAAAGIITLPPGSATGRAWTVTVTPREHGDAIDRAVKVIASHLYGIHRGRGVPGREYSQYPATDEEIIAASGFAIPRQAAELLAPFERPGFA